MAIFSVILLRGDIGIEFEPSKAGGWSHSFGIESSAIRSRPLDLSSWSARAHIQGPIRILYVCEFLRHLDGKVLT